MNHSIRGLKLRIICGARDEILFTHTKIRLQDIEPSGGRHILAAHQTRRALAPYNRPFAQVCLVSPPGLPWANPLPSLNL